MQASGLQNLSRVSHIHDRDRFCDTLPRDLRVLHPDRREAASAVRD